MFSERICLFSFFYLFFLLDIQFNSQMCFLFVLLLLALFVPFVLGLKDADVYSAVCGFFLKFCFSCVFKACMFAECVYAAVFRKCLRIARVAPVSPEYFNE